MQDGDCSGSGNVDAMSGESVSMANSIILILAIMIKNSKG